MANLFVNLPATPSTGIGTQVDTSAMGGEKTITVQDAFRGSVVIEGSLDGGTTWFQAAVFTSTGKKVLDFAAQFARVRRLGVPQIDPGLPNVDISANDDGAMFVTLPGAGVSINTATLGNFKTVTVQNLVSGGTVNIQVSDDNVRWATCMTFKSSDVQFKDFTAQFMRFVGSGASVSVGAINDSGAASDFRPTTTFIWDPTGSRPPAPNVYIDFATLHTNANQVEGPKTVLIDSGGVGSAVLPVGAYDFSEWTIIGQPFVLVPVVFGTRLIITEGTTITIGQLQLGENLAIEFTGTTPPFVPTNGQSMILYKGAALFCTGAGPMISLSTLAPGEVFLLFLYNGGTLADGGAGQPIIDIPVAGAVLFSNIFSGGQILRDTISGVIGSVWSFSVGSSDSQVSLDQPGFSGSFFINEPQVPRWFPNFPALAPKPVTDIIMGQAHVYDTTGGVIAQPLPSTAALLPGESVIFKKNGGAFSLDLIPAPGEVIDGAASFSITSTQGSIMLIRDIQVSPNWVVFGAGP